MSTVPSNRDSSQQRIGIETGQVTSYPVGVPPRLRYPNIPAWGLLDRAQRNLPDKVAAEFLGREFTYTQIHTATTRLAAWLQQRNVQAGERVGILLPNCPEYLISLNAIWRAGGVAVAISPLSVPADVRSLLQLTDCRTVISLDLLSGLLPPSHRRREEQARRTLLVSLNRYLPAWKQPPYLVARWARTGRLRFPNHGSQTWFWDAVRDSHAELIPVETLPATDPAYILSTGGTTGNPKAVTLSHRNVVANAWQQMHWAGATLGEETLLAILPFFHSYGMSAMLATGMALGAKLIVQPRFHVGQALRAIERHRPTVFHAVPAMLAAMNRRLRKRPADLSSIKWVISGGASLPTETASEFTAHSGALVVEGYGLSEASPVTHVGPLDGTNMAATIGLPLPDTECRIVDMETGHRDTRPGEVGELIVQGPQVMLGYWNNPQATEQAIRDGWLYTGDLAIRTSRGFYKIVDRKKDLIITSGFNVYPADVEQVLRQCEVVADVAVVGVPDEQRGEIVKAFVVLKAGYEWDPARLERFCVQELAAHRRPRAWEHVRNDLPRNFLGKVVRRELRDSSTVSGEKP